MHTFSFCKSEESTRYCNRICEALERFCNRTKEESIQLVEQFFARLDDIESYQFLYEEPPYYYAMCIAHHPTLGDNNPQWHLDKRYWPPPPGWVFS